MTTSTLPPKRPRPVLPIINATASLLYVAATIVYFAIGRPVLGLIWLACSLIWLCYSLPTSVRTHRLRVEMWERRMRTWHQLRELNARMERWTS